MIAVLAVQPTGTGTAETSDALAVLESDKGEWKKLSLINKEAGAAAAVSKLARIGSSLEAGRLAARMRMRLSQTVDKGGPGREILSGLVTGGM